jgi:hypothetical protein
MTLADRITAWRNSPAGEEKEHHIELLSECEDRLNEITGLVGEIYDNGGVRIGRLNQLENWLRVVGWKGPYRDGL